MRLPRIIAPLFILSLGALAQSIPPHMPRPGIDIIHYDFDVTLPDSGRSIAVLASIQFRRFEPVAALRLDLRRLHVDSVRLGGRPGRFRRDSVSILVDLPRAKGGLHDTLELAVKYHGDVADGLIIRSDPSGRWTAFGDNWPDRARNWLASVDDPADKATVTWRVNAPSSLTVVANGALVETHPLPSATPRTLTVWAESKPIPVYLMVIAAARMDSMDLGETAPGTAATGGGVSQSLYVFPEDRDFIPGPFANAKDIVEFFSRIVAPFPFEKLAHLESSTIFGGMENATAIFYSDRGFRRRSMRADLIAHETAHQWFGDAVTESAWAHLWLSEGFATYFEELWEQHAKGDSTFRHGMSGMRDEILRSRVSLERPVIDSTQSNLVALLNTNSYQKGAWTLHMLRAMVGDSLFYHSLRLYYREHLFGNATSDDLESAFERTTGENLRWYFDEWLRRPGFVEAKIEWRYIAATQRVTVNVTQDGRFAPYRFPLLLEIRNSKGWSTKREVEIPAFARTSVEVAGVIPSSPTSIVPDPDVELLGIVTVVGGATNR